MTRQYPENPIVGYSETPTQRIDQILKSTTGLRQVGGTLAGGQGILPAGTVVARKASDKKWYLYNNAGSGGIDVARGVLNRAYDTGTAGSTDQLCIIYRAGVLVNSKLSGADSSAITDLGGHVDTVLDEFRF